MDNAIGYNVLGHNRQKDFFKKVIESSKLSHSYIFSGVSGIGKKLFAKELARNLFCLNGSYFNPCDCLSCQQVKAGTYPDLYIYEGSDLKVENIRLISEQASMTGFSNKWKVFILDEAEKLSNSSQMVAGNALLKTLEEPEAYTLFLLITSKYEMIMPTIRSRCGNITFSPLGYDDMKNILENIRPNIKNVDNIIKLSGGSISQALMIDDLNISFLMDSIKSNDFKDFVGFILNCQDTKTLQVVMEYLYPLALFQYKSTGAYSFCAYGDYILETLRDLNYNVNLDLAKHDFISKTVEVFGSGM